MNRREFIRSALAGGVLMATSELPLAAEDNPLVFPQRGRYERLALGYVTVRAGARKPFSILHISDTHLTAAAPDEDVKKLRLMLARTKTFGGRQEEALRDSLAWARLNVDYVLHTGDLIDWQSNANFALVKKYFGERMFGAVGNHEYSSDLWLSEPKQEKTEAGKARTRARLADAYPMDIAFSSQIVNGVNFVTIDDAYGTVTAEQVRRFGDEVAKGLPIILCMHVPFFTDDIWRATSKFWAHPDSRFENGEVPPPAGDYRRQLDDPVTRGFIAELKREPLLKAILAGHEHVAVSDRFSPVAVEHVVGANFLFQGQEVLVI